MKKIGTCDHCGDPIYDFQKKTEMHEGCAELKEKEKKSKRSKRAQPLKMVQRFIVWPIKGFRVCMANRSDPATWNVK